MKMKYDSTFYCCSVVLLPLLLLILFIFMNPADTMGRLMFGVLVELTFQAGGMISGHLRCHQACSHFDFSA